jgi:hypothetical protein
VAPFHGIAGNSVGNRLQLHVCHLGDFGINTGTRARTWHVKNLRCLSLPTYGTERVVTATRSCFFNAEHYITGAKVL